MYREDVTLLESESNGEHPHATLRGLREAAGFAWWTDFLARHCADVARRAAEAKVISWHPGPAMPLDLFSYLREATGCYTLARFLAAISLASALVEAILNRDSRLAGRGDLQRVDGWILLNNRNLLRASEAGLPVRELLGPAEAAADEAPLSFIHLRNRIAHGHLAGFPGQLSDESPALEGAARTQLDKASRFLVAWFNTCPDIQNRAPTEQRAAS